MSDDSLLSLKPDTKNRRQHSPRNIDTIVSSLQEVGAARSIVIDEDDNILAGNGTVEAATKAGMDRLRIVEADGEEIIAVRRRGLTEDQKRRLALFDNRTAELADWNQDQIAADIEAGLDFEGIFSGDELTDILADLAVTTDPLADPDEVPEPPEDPITQRGDLITLGKHRLLCGDATVITDVERLMDGKQIDMLLTDPPYAVDYVGKARDMNKRGYGHSRAKGRAAITGDGIEAGQEAGLWRDVLSLTFELCLAENAAIYIWHAQGRAMLDLYNLLKELGILHHQTIIWKKNNFVIGRCDYQWIHEPCFYGWKQGSRPSFRGAHNQTTVWEVARDTQRPEHPTQKPVEVFERPIRNHLRSGQSVYDPFLGSGTCLIAAESADIACYGMEIDPRYCDVIVNRWQSVTGKTAIRPD